MTSDSNENRSIFFLVFVPTLISLGVFIYFEIGHYFEDIFGIDKIFGADFGGVVATIFFFVMLFIYSIIFAITHWLDDDLKQLPKMEVLKRILKNKQQEKSNNEQSQFIFAFRIILYIGLIALGFFFFVFLGSISSWLPPISAIFLTGLGYYVQNILKHYKEQFKICPYCAEKVKKVAIICKHCGRDF